jgi:TonB family protein
MHKYWARYFTAVAAAALILGQTNFASRRNSAALIRKDDQWISFAPPYEEFRISVPGSPTMRIYPVSNDPRSNQEKVLAHREYGGYGGGVIFIIHSFKAEHPEKIKGGLLSLVNATDAFQRIQFDGVTAEVFRGTVENRNGSYTKNTLRFTTDKHLYVVALMALEETNPGVERFISSLGVRKAGDQITAIDQPIDGFSSNPLPAREVTRRAIIVSKGEPFYTQDARAHRVVGTVTIEAVFGENGYVTDITVIKGLKDGLTEAAIDAARSIRFFPAEKDGQRVSQKTILEYGFNVY